MVSIVKDNTDQESWFSAKPIEVGNLNNILAGTELNLIQDGINFIIIYSYKNAFLFCKYQEIVKILLVSM